MWVASCVSDTVGAARYLLWRVCWNVNPNYKYCVVYHDASECGLTDDIGVAMEHAALVSKRRRFDNINVCRIVKSVNDGTYKTKIEGWCSDGHYYDKVHSDGDYLHFDFIAQRANVYKIS